MTDPERDPWPSVEDTATPAACPYCEALDDEPHGEICPLMWRGPIDPVAAADALPTLPTSVPPAMTGVVWPTIRTSIAKESGETAMKQTPFRKLRGLSDGQLGTALGNHTHVLRGLVACAAQQERWNQRIRWWIWGLSGVALIEILAVLLLWTGR